MADSNELFSAKQRDAINTLQLAALVTLLVENAGASVPAEPAIRLVVYVMLGISGLALIYMLVEPRKLLRRAGVL